MRLLLEEVIRNTFDKFWMRWQIDTDGKAVKEIQYPETVLHPRGSYLTQRFLLVSKGKLKDPFPVTGANLPNRQKDRVLRKKLLGHDSLIVTATCLDTMSREKHELSRRFR